MFFYGWTLIANLCLCLLFSVWGFALRLSKRWCCLLRNFYPHDPGVQVGSERQAGFWISGSRGECHLRQQMWRQVSSILFHICSWCWLLAGVILPLLGRWGNNAKYARDHLISSATIAMHCIVNAIWDGFSILAQLRFWERSSPIIAALHWYYGSRCVSEVAVACKVVEPKKKWKLLNPHERESFLTQKKVKFVEPKRKWKWKFLNQQESEGELSVNWLRHYRSCDN